MFLLSLINVILIFLYEPNRCEDPRYVIGTEPSPDTEAAGVLEVGKTPYRPYVF